MHITDKKETQPPVTLHKSAPSYSCKITTTFFLTEIANKYIMKIRRNNIFILPSPAEKGDRGAVDEEIPIEQTRTAEARKIYIKIHYRLWRG